MPFELGADLYFSRYLIPSEANPVDDRTRTRATRERRTIPERMECVFAGGEPLRPEGGAAGEFVTEWRKVEAHTAGVRLR